MDSSAHRKPKTSDRHLGFGFLEKLIPSFTILLALFWCMYGIWLFFLNPGAIPEKWNAGELGDFFGGGLGGLAIIGLVYTTWVSSRQFELHKKTYGVQADQLEIQRQDMAEAGVLRVYEALKPELEGVSMRIMSKLMKARKIQFTRQDFEKNANKFHNGDRTVFLRLIQKFGVTSNNVQLGTQSQDTQEAKLAVERFIEIMATLDTSLSGMEKMKGAPHDDFCRGLRETEIFKCYHSLKQI